MENDWRLQGQEEYLTGVTLYLKKYVRYSATWDHDHCEFCWAKFADLDVQPEALREGYATIDNYRWICATCFDDFRDRFEWKIGQVQRKNEPAGGDA